MGNFDCSFCGADEGEPCRSRACQEAAKLRAEVERLKAFAAERDDDTKGMTRRCEQLRSATTELHRLVSAGNRAAAKAEDERDVALLQVRELSMALERISYSCDGLAKDAADAALGYTEKQQDESGVAYGEVCPQCGLLARISCTC
jgi:hypothetical protein